MTTSFDGNRRRHERFTVPPMYSSVTAELPDGAEAVAVHGHVYDVSETGVRIELDEPLEAGQIIALRISLPCSDAQVRASGHVVWINSRDDDPGPRRMALRFTDFQTESDRDRLISYLDRGHLRRAA